MGLDLVELVMEVEDRFGVNLPDEGLARVSTVSDLASLVTSKLAINSSACASSQTFYRVRRALVESGQPRAGIRPSTKLVDLKPMKRRQVWRKLRRLDGGRRLRRHLQDATTVADLVRVMAPARLPDDPSDRIIAEHMILEKIREITSEQLGIRLERVRPESDFIKDLGAG